MLGEEDHRQADRRYTELLTEVRRSEDVRNSDALASLASDPRFFFRLVRDRQYTLVYHGLKHILDVNLYQVDHLFYDMSLLEHCVYEEDWLMVCLLVRHGADPRFNTFKGTSLVALLPAFYERFEPIPGYDGLRALIDVTSSASDWGVDFEQRKAMIHFINLIEFCKAYFENQRILMSKDEVLTALDHFTDHGGYDNYDRLDAFRTELREKMGIVETACVQHGLCDSVQERIENDIATTVLWFFFTEEVVLETVQAGET